MLPIETDEIKKLLEELNAMKNVLAQLLEEKEYMIVYESLRIEADYMNKIGHEEYQIYQFDLKLKRLNRKIEIIRELISAKQPIDMIKIDAQIESEFAQEKKENSKREDRICFLSEEENKAKLSKEKTKTLKEMYYQFAKKLHPDINPNITENELALWHKVQEAYINGDIEQMSLLYEIYEKELEHEIIFDQKEDIQKRIEKIRDMIMQTLEQIAEIKQSFPFTFEEKLKDNDWLFGKAAVNRELMRQLKEEYSIGQDTLRMMLSSVGILY